MIQKIKQHFKNVIKAKKSPSSIALGFAIGTFIAMLPTFSFGFVFGIIVLFIWPKVNKFTLMSSFLIWNIFTLAPFYALGYKIGDLIFGSSPVSIFKIELINKVFDLTRRLLVGNAIIGIIISISLYYIIKSLVILYRKKHSLKK